MVRVAIVCAYDGSGFRGFARQQGLRTVQGEIEGALERLARDPIVTVGAGRTDSGVHARHQVLHADVPERIAAEPPALCRRLQAITGRDLTVYAVSGVSKEFDARFSALERCYHYLVDDRPFPDPLLRHTVAAWPHPVSVSRMRAGAKTLLGTHDFSAFCRPRPGQSLVREVRRLAIERREGLVSFRVDANAFLHQMVRRVVGLLLEVGDGYREPEEVAEVLEGKDRSRSSRIAHPEGLTLIEVRYPARFHIPSPL
ncbi:MAG: tRNA pseudouridine(38-40) synthase TruA [Actinomycetota bacterium]